MTPENRNLIMAVALSMVVLLGWQILVIQPEMEREAVEQERVAAEMAKAGAANQTTGQPSVSAANGNPTVGGNASPSGAGQIAKRDADAMTVRLPSATIGVRGTSVAGDVDEDGSAQVILLGPAADNSLGLPAGAINIANQAGVVDITRPGFVTEIAAFTMPPEPPTRSGGLRGEHSEHLAPLLKVMQGLARAHPGATW